MIKILKAGIFAASITLVYLLGSTAAQAQNTSNMRYKNFVYEDDFPIDHYTCGSVYKSLNISLNHASGTKDLISSYPAFAQIDLNARGQALQDKAVAYVNLRPLGDRGAFNAIWTGRDLAVISQFSDMGMSAGYDLSNPKVTYKDAFSFLSECDSKFGLTPNIKTTLGDTPDIALTPKPVVPSSQESLLNTVCGGYYIAMGEAFRASGNAEILTHFTQKALRLVELDAGSSDQRYTQKYMPAYKQAARDTAESIQSGGMTFKQLDAKTRLCDTQQKWESPDLSAFIK